VGHQALWIAVPIVTIGIIVAAFALLKKRSRKALGV
jgi:hypothetical protein